MPDKKEIKDTPVRIMITLHIPKADPSVAIEIRRLLEPVAKEHNGADLNVSLGTVRG